VQGPAKKESPGEGLACRLSRDRRSAWYGTSRGSGVSGGGQGR
jgi:hypothetical protein